MTFLHLIRHGQASFDKEDYDQLSPTGWRQGQLLGKYLNHTIKTDNFVIISGHMQRHRQTTEALISELESRPEVLFDPGWNEIDHVAILEASRPDLGDFQTIKAWIMKQPKPRVVFQHCFEAAMLRWASRLHDEDYTETHYEFLARVQQALAAALQKAGQVERIVIITSCIPIIAVVKTVLSLEEPACRALEAVLANASLSMFLYHHGSLRLSCFNNISFLEGEDDSLVTKR